MATVTFWNNNNYGGESDAFNGAQRHSYSSSAAWDSLKTGAGTWLVIWNDSSYTGDYKKIGPNQNYSDLNHTDRSGGGDWKNQITSFIIYGNQPSWWNDSSAPPNDDLNLQPNDAVFCTGTYFNGNTAVFPADVSEPDLNSVAFPTNTYVDMKNDIQSLATGSSAWLEIFNETNYGGSSLKIYPNTTYPDLNKVSRSPSGDWKNQMQSFKLYKTLPEWSLGFDQDTFFDSFPGAIAMKDTSGDYYHYMTQDCGYDIRITGISYSPTSIVITFRLDYDLAGHNDKVNLTLEVDSTGAMVSVTYDYEQGGAIQIPSSVIKAVDVSAEVLGAVGALETAGISEEAANSFIEAFDTFCDVFNKISNGLYKLSEANDGRFYLVAACTQMLCRALPCVTGTNPNG
jgi:hypothetical protein